MVEMAQHHSEGSNLSNMAGQMAEMVVMEGIFIFLEIITYHHLKTYLKKGILKREKVVMVRVQKKMVKMVKI